MGMTFSRPRCISLTQHLSSIGPPPLSPSPLTSPAHPSGRDLIVAHHCHSCGTICTYQHHLPRTIFKSGHASSSAATVALHRCDPAGILEKVNSIKAKWKMFNRRYFVKNQMDKWMRQNYKERAWELFKTSKRQSEYAKKVNIAQNENTSPQYHHPCIIRNPLFLQFSTFFIFQHLYSRQSISSVF